MQGRATAFLLMAAIVILSNMGYAGQFIPAPDRLIDQTIDPLRTRVEISFNFAAQSGMASNQIAVWVADGDGNLIRTLFVTNFTAKRRGWQFRTDTLPLWVSESGIVGMTDEQIDAISRATPESGLIRYAWYGDDNKGRSVPPGEYLINIEGSLRGENRVLYQATVQLGGQGMEITPKPLFFGTDTADRNMLTNVVVRYQP